MSKRLRAYYAFVDALSATEGSAAGGKSGVFDLIGDDEISSIFSRIISRSSAVGNSLAAVEEASSSHRDVVALALTCRRLAGVLSSTAKQQKKEALAMASTVIAPSAECKTFSEQVNLEERSGRHLNLLKHCNVSMALHCAGPCCARMHKALNRELLKLHGGERSLHCVLAQSTLVDPTPDGDVVFAYQRVKTSKRSLHGEERGRRFVDQIVRVRREFNGDSAVFSVSDVHVLDTTERSAPLLLRSNASGSAVAFICTTHDVTGNQAPAPFSEIAVWFAGVGVVVVPPPDGMPGPPLSPQFCAWGGDALSVAFSTDFVHPSGHTIGSNAASPDGAFSSYCFGKYMAEDGSVEMEEATSTYAGTLVSCSWTQDVSEALVITKSVNVVTKKKCRTALLHQIDVEGTWPVALKAPGAVKPFSGPLCATISKTGDCVISIMRTPSSLQLQVAVRSSNALFTVVKSMEVAPYLTLVPPSPHTDASFVRAIYEVGFSHCGRYATILDRHAFFGTSAANHGFVVVDLAQRLDTGPLRAQPLFGTDDTAPRSVHWTRSGVFVQAPGTDELGNVSSRGGLLCLCAK